jgi:hypothetical protein
MLIRTSKLGEIEGVSLAICMDLLNHQNLIGVLRYGLRPCSGTSAFYFFGVKPRTVDISRSHNGQGKQPRSLFIFQIPAMIPMVKVRAGEYEALRSMPGVNVLGGALGEAGNRSIKIGSGSIPE